MGTDIVVFPSKGLVNCCDCACSSLTMGSSVGGWIRSVKRKYGEFESSSRLYIPDLDILPVARVGIENEYALLRETVSKQQETIQELGLELNEERNASSSAASEAMSMILRLQSEKAEVEMEARQFKRFFEDKMSHDGQEIEVLAKVLCKREEAIQSLTCEVQEYKDRMMSYGVSEYEVELLKGNYSHSTSSASDAQGQGDYPCFTYPPLRCKLNEAQGPLEIEDDIVDIDRYPFDETPRTRDLKNLEHRNGNSGSRNVLEKFIGGQTHTRAKHSRKLSADSASSYGFGRDMSQDYTADSPKWETSFKKLDCVTEELRMSDYASDYDDDMSDRVYTVDSIHPSQPCKNSSEPRVASEFFDEFVSTPTGSIYMDSAEPEVKKLYSRIQALEADRESMRQSIISMQTDRAQLVLLKEIAQHLCKDMTPAKPKSLQKPSIIKLSPLLAIFKWILPFICWRRKSRQNKYMFDLAGSNPGLLMLLDRSPRTKLWRCITSTQIRNQI